MNFWKLLRWISTALFVLLILLALLSTLSRFEFTTGAAQDAPRPAPLIVH